MTREEHAQLLAGMLEAPGDVAVLSKGFASLSEDYAGTLANSVLATEQIAQLTKANEDLVKQNMDFFQKIAVVPDEISELTPDENLKFENLFDEKGNLK